MVTMENSEEILQILERFTQLKQKEIPKELEDYLQYVAKTGDTIFKWSSLKYLFREKLLNVIKHFNEESSRLEEIPNYPNVDPFNYETMKSSLLERLDLFNAAPFTVQRLCELLIDPRKQYSRIDKFMRALEKNILVVSTIDPGRKRTESENGDSLDSVGNGDLSLEVNIDIEMENENIFNNVDDRNGANEESSTGALKANCPRTDDAGALPKAKKAKLDFDENELLDEDDLDEDGIKSIKSKANQDNSDAVDATDEAAYMKMKTMAADGVPVIPEIEEPDEEDEEESPAKSNGGKVHKEETSAPDADPPTVAEPDDEANTSAAEAVKETVTVTYAKDESTEAVEQDSAEEQSKVVEKQELEGAEKEEKPSEVKESSEKSEIGAAEDADEKKDLTTNVRDKSEAAQDTEKPVKASPEKPNDSTAAASKVVAEKEVRPEASTVDAEPKTESQLETKKAADVDKSNTDKTETKEGAAEVAAESAAADAAADAAAAADVDAAAAATTTTKPAADDKKEPNKTAIADAAEDGDAGAEEPATVPIDTDELATPQSPVAADASATPVSDAANFVSSTAPTLALNDQPMEDTPAEEEVTHVSPGTGVEEVIMAESGAVAGDMATDEVAKDEPAAMEVDDTSQEVMDQ